MIYDVEHLFICLYIIYISSLAICLLMSLTHFKIWLFVFILLNFIVLCVSLDNSSLLDVSFGIIIFPMASFLIFLMLSFEEQKFLILMKSILSVIFSCNMSLMLYLKKYPYA